MTSARHAILIACVLLFGPVRFPMDDAGTHWEIRGRLCSSYGSSRIEIETRTYQRVMVMGRYAYSHDSVRDQTFPEPKESWWYQETVKPLHIRLEALPETEAQPEMSQ